MREPHHTYIVVRGGDVAIIDVRGGRCGDSSRVERESETGARHPFPSTESLHHIAASSRRRADATRGSLEDMASRLRPRHSPTRGRIGRRRNAARLHTPAMRRIPVLLLEEEGHARCRRRDRGFRNRGDSPPRRQLVTTWQPERFGDPSSTDLPRTRSGHRGRQREDRGTSLTARTASGRS